MDEIRQFSVLSISVLLISFSSIACAAEVMKWEDIKEAIAKNCTDQSPMVLENKVINGELNFSSLDLINKSINQTDYERERDEFDKKTKIIRSISCPITIKNSIINGNLEFSNILFEKNIEIINTTVKDANFYGAVFNRKANFAGSSFNGESVFVASQFKAVNFDGTKFNGPAEFDGSETEFAYFENTTFNKSANFKTCVFKNHISFDSSKFLGPADFAASRFLVYSSFVKSHFNDSASFKQTDFRKDAYFRQSRFRGPVQFAGANFSNDPKFDYAVFDGVGDFSDVIVNNLNFKNVKIENFYSNWDIAKSKLKLDDDYRTIRIYESLREQYIKSFLGDDANDCYYETMKVKAHLTDDSWTSYLIDRGQRYLYGYGVKPHYPLILSVGVIVIFWLLFRLTGIKKALLFSYNVFLSGTGKLLVDAPELPKDSSDLAMLFYNMERFFGLLLFSVFLIALTKSVA